MPTEGCARGVLESPHLPQDAGVLSRPGGAWAGFEAGPAGPGLQPAGPAARHSPPTRGAARKSRCATGAKQEVLPPTSPSQVFTWLPQVGGEVEVGVAGSTWSQLSWANATERAPGIPTTPTRRAVPPLKPILSAVMELSLSAGLCRTPQS